MVNCSEKNNEHKISLTTTTANTSKLQVSDAFDSIRVRNALNRYSNGTTSQPPDPPNIPNTGASATPPKRLRKRKETGIAALVTTPAQVPGAIPPATVTVIVKNRFKHRPAYVPNGTPTKKQKTGLEVISENYQEVSSHSPSSNSTDIQGQPGPASIVQTSTSMMGALQPQQKLTTTVAATTLQQRVGKPTSSLSLCSCCKSTDTVHMGNGFYKCLKCQRNYMPLKSFHPTNAQTTVTTAILPAATFYGVDAKPVGNQQIPSPAIKSATDAQGGKGISTRRAKQLETIDLVSSDEDEEKSDTSNQSTNTSDSQTQHSRIAERMKLPGGETSGNNKTATRTAKITSPVQPSPSPSPKPQETTSEYTFHCNKVMFGELYGQSVAATRVVDSRMFLSLECVIVRQNIQTSEKYTLSVGENDVKEIFVYFGRIPSFVAIQTAPKFASVACARIGKEVLRPESEDTKKRYIILALNSAFKNDNEADAELRNLTAAVSPWAKLTILPHNEAKLLIEKVKLDVFQKELQCYGKTAKALGPVEKLLTYPPSMKSGIPITTLDVACLDEGTYLNDVIIDFYLKYICESVMTKEQREKTYIFNSYFYKRLTLKSSSKNPSLMHAQVRKWTRNVDIFQKDFIIIPVNEHCHWYLVIICFPRSSSKVDSNEKEEEEEEDETPDFIMKEVENLNSDGTSEVTEAPDLSATPSPPPPPPSAGQTEDLSATKPPSKDFEDKKLEKPIVGDSPSKADFDDQCKEIPPGNVAAPTGMESTPDLDPPSPAAPIFKQATDLDDFVRPCVLIFDSLLISTGHSKVFTNLRHYLTQEWTSRKPKEPPRIFDKETMKGCYPKIPRQNNDCDCGVFILQYAEYFFTKPVKNFRIPMHLENWFTIDSVTKKRNEIKDLIHKLSETYKKESTANKNTVKK